MTAKAPRKKTDIKHTPGPWRTGSLVSYLGTGEPVAYVYRRPPDDDREDHTNRIQVLGGDDCDADAALIAAAPELLAACLAALPHHQGARSKVGKLLEAAITKAVGR